MKNKREIDSLNFFLPPFLFKVERQEHASEKRKD